MAAMGRRRRASLHRHEAGAARAANAQQVTGAAVRDAERLDGLLAARDGRAIHFHDDVARLEARALRGAARDDVRDDGALGAAVDAELPGDVGRERLEREANPPLLLGLLQILVG